ncbi:MAG: 2-hydroxychromene-2-carboxylate isomerase [Bacteriovoracaceae bacterium]
MKELNFYFDFLSPFSFFAWKRFEHLELSQKYKINFRPVALGSLLNHWQIKGPGEITPKREFLLKQCLRYAAKNQIEFTTPKTHPFNSLYALRLSLKSVARDDQEKVIKTLWKAGWINRIDMGEPEELLKVLKEAQLPAEELYEKSFSREAKSELKNNIQEAIGYGVFGVPSFVVDGELFWGNDSVEDLLHFLEGSDYLDRNKLKLLLDSTPRAALQQIT